MSQEEILRILKNDKKIWFTTHDLADKLGLNVGSVTRAAKRLRYAEFVHYKQIEEQKNNGCRTRYIYSYKEEQEIY